METLTQVAAANKATGLSLNFLLLFGHMGSGSCQESQGREIEGGPECFS